MAVTARSTVLTISGITAPTAAVTAASSLLMIFSIRSVGNRSMSTELGFRRSVLIDDYSTLQFGKFGCRRIAPPGRAVLSKLKNVSGRIPLPKGEGGPKGRVRGTT